MKKSLQSLVSQRSKVTWPCVGLLLLLSGVAGAQQVPVANPPVKGQYVPLEQPITVSPTIKTMPIYANPAAALAVSSQIHFDVMYAIIPDGVLMKWAIPRKAIIKRVANNESQPIKKPKAGASREFSLLFGSETPVPLLFDAELRQSLLSAAVKDARTNLLAAPSVTAAWNRETSIRLKGEKDEASPLSLKMKASHISNGELNLVIDAKVAEAPDFPHGKQSHWNLRARAGHTLMLPLAQPDRKRQLLLLVVPKIIGGQPATQYVPTQIAEAQPSVYPHEPVTRQSYRPVNRGPSSTVPQQVPSPSYVPIPQTSYRPSPWATRQVDREMVSLSVDLVVAPNDLIPDRFVEFNLAQRKAWLKSVSENGATNRQQMQTATDWKTQARLTPPHAKGQAAPFDLRLTPKRTDDGNIILDVKGTVCVPTFGEAAEATFETTLKAKPNITLLLPMAINHPDKRVALLIQPAIVSSDPSLPARSQAVANTPAKGVATLQILILDVNTKVAREVVSATRKQEEQQKKVDVQLLNKGDSQPNKARTSQADMRSFVMNASLGKLFVADLKKQDTSFRVISRPQVRTLVGVAAALETHGGKEPSQQIGGLGLLKLSVTPKEIDGKLVVRSLVSLLGPTKSQRAKDLAGQLKIEAESTNRSVPGETAVMMLGGKNGERSIIVLTDLVQFERGKRKATQQFTQAPPLIPAQHNNPISNSTRLEPSKPNRNMRVVNLSVMNRSDLVAGDLVDVLLFEKGGSSESKIETLYESLTVFAAAKAVNGECSPVKLLVEKEIVTDLLLAQDKGMLRLILNHSVAPNESLNARRPLPAARPSHSLQPWGNRLNVKPGTRVVYTDDGSWEMELKQPIFPASGIQAPQRIGIHPGSRFNVQPKSEVQQVLEEVREMRKALQDLRKDMNRLRNSVPQDDSEPR